MNRILDDNTIFDNCGIPSLVGTSLRENIKKKHLFIYIDTTCQLLDKEFLKWLTERGAAEPVLRMRDGSTILESYVKSHLKFQVIKVFSSLVQLNVTKIEKIKNFQEIFANYMLRKLIEKVTHI